jgi:hypothetical protein
MIYPCRSSWRARHNGAVQIDIRYCLWWCHIHAINALALSYIISCILWLVLHQMLETPTLEEIVSIKSYPSVCDHFSFILCRSWPCKSGTNSRQQPRSNWSATDPRNQQLNQPNQTPQTHNGKLHGLLSVPHQSDRWHWSDRWTLPVRSVTKNRCTTKF